MQDFQTAASYLARGRIVVLTGPGLLAGAGLTPPEQRGGLWDRFDPLLCATPRALERTPECAWTAFGTWLSLVRGAAAQNDGPSRAHRALVRLFDAGLVRGVICTTTDGLVRQSGIDKVAELYGAIDRLRCTACTKRAPAPEVMAYPAPRCAYCGAATRPDMVLFEETMPRRPRERAAQWVYGGGSVLSLGAVLTRPPIHRIPEEMLQEGGRTVALDPVKPGAVLRVRGIHLPGDINDVLPTLVEQTLAATTTTGV